MQMTIENISKFLYTANNGDAYHRSCLTGEPYNFFLTPERKRLFENIGFINFLNQLSIGIYSWEDVLAPMHDSSDRNTWQHLIVPYLFTLPDDIIKQSFIHAFETYSTPRQTKKLIYLIIKSPFFYKSEINVVKHVMNNIGKKRQKIFRDFFTDIILKNIHKCEYEHFRFIYNLTTIGKDYFPRKYYPALMSLARTKNVDIELGITFILKLLDKSITDSMLAELKNYLNFLINKRKYIKQQLSFYDKVKDYLTTEEQQYYDKKFMRKFVHFFA